MYDLDESVTGVTIELEFNDDNTATVLVEVRFADDTPKRVQAVVNMTPLKALLPGMMSGFDWESVELPVDTVTLIPDTAEDAG